MGIYYGDKIYGIKILQYLEKDKQVLYERIQKHEITIDEIKQIYEQICTLYGDNNIELKVYMDCTTTYDGIVTSRTWTHMNKNFELPV